MAKKSESIGILLYPEFLPIFRDMDAQELKEVIVAALEYGKGENVNEPTGNQSKIVWTLLKPRIDANKEKYQETCNNRAYGRYCQVMRDKGKDPLSREEWDNGRKS